MKEGTKRILIKPRKKKRTQVERTNERQKKKKKKRTKDEIEECFLERFPLKISCNYFLSIIHQVELFLSELNNVAILNNKVTITASCKYTFNVKIIESKLNRQVLFFK